MYNLNCSELFLGILNCDQNFCQWYTLFMYMHIKYVVHIWVKKYVKHKYWINFTQRKYVIFVQNANISVILLHLILKCKMFKNQYHNEQFLIIILHTSTIIILLLVSDR